VEATVTIERDFDERFLAARQYLTNTLRKRFRSMRPDEIADLVQDVYVQCRPKFVGVRDPKLFKSWLVSCAFNLALARFRRASRVAKRHSALVDRTTMLEATRRDEASPLQRVLRAEREAQIKDVTDALPEKVSEAFFLRFRDGLSFVKIAAVQESVEPTVKSRVHRAIIGLRSKLAA
jgi:RNA polymerase sigma factor (sigma-70 family)